MSPEERYWRAEAEYLRDWAREGAKNAARCDHAANLIALESLSLAEVEALQRLCRRDCPDALAAEGRG